LFYFSGFAGAGAPVFSSPQKTDDTNSPKPKDTENAEDDFVPTAEFKPVIPLPPLVQVQRGDENELKLFEHRAKIYRFQSETKEWKERGVGNIVILQDKSNPMKMRVVMWRERVLKPACNFNLTSKIKVDYYQMNKKIVTWSAIDFADSEGTPEIFTCRFGTEEKVSFTVIFNC